MPTIIPEDLEGPFDVVYPKAIDPQNPNPRKRHAWLKVGVAFPSARRDRLDIRVDAIPLQFSGKLCIFLRKAKPGSREEESALTDAAVDAATAGT